MWLSALCCVFFCRVFLLCLSDFYIYRVYNDILVCDVHVIVRVLFMSVIFCSLAEEWSNCISRLWLNEL